MVWYIVDTIPKLRTTGVFHQHVRILGRDYAVRFYPRQKGGSDYPCTAWLYDTDKNGNIKGTELLRGKTPREVITEFLRRQGYTLDDWPV